MQSDILMYFLFWVYCKKHININQWLLKYGELDSDNSLFFVRYFTKILQNGLVGYKK